MSSNFIPDYNPDDGSFTVGGRIPTDKNVTAMALDTVLTGFADGDTDTTPLGAVKLVRGFLSQVPLEVLGMFKPFVFAKDVNWDDQYSAVEAITGTFQPKTTLKDRWQEWLDGVAADFGGGPGLTMSEVLALWKADREKRRTEWVTDFETKTGLNLDEGVQKFLVSLAQRQKENRLDWVTDFETKTGLNIDEGIVKLLQSWRAAQKANRMDWISEFEDQTGLNVDEGAAAFLTSMLAKLRPEWKKDVPDWVTEFETKTGLEIDSGIAAFLASLKTQLRPEWQKDDGAWVADFETKTGLNIDEGTVKFVQSLVAKLRSEWQKDVPDWVAEFEAKTGLNIDEGVLKFLQSWRDVQKANRMDWVTEFETQSGLNIDEGAAKFLQSLLAKMKPEWDKDTTPIADRIKDLIDGITNGIDGGSGSNRPVADIIAAILGVRDKATVAQEAADRANIGIAAIIASQNGGDSDEFNYPSAATLAMPWLLVTEGVAAGTYGPDGAGMLVWKHTAVFAGTGFRYYLRTDKPLTASNKGSVTVVLSKAPRQNAAAPAHAYAIGKASATDKACIRAEISAKGIEIQIIDAAGTVSRGTVATISCADGDTFELVWDATNAWVMRNNIEVVRRNITASVTDTNHRLIGLGAMIPPYTALNFANNPCPHFAGIAWHP